jgi:hypothetical protein
LRLPRRCAPRNDEKAMVIPARARHSSLPLGESFEIAALPSARRNDEKKAPGNADPLRDFLIGITSFLCIIV